MTSNHLHHQTTGASCRVRDTALAHYLLHVWHFIIAGVRSQFMFAFSGKSASLRAQWEISQFSDKSRFFPVGNMTVLLYTSACMRWRSQFLSLITKHYSSSQWHRLQGCFFFTKLNLICHVKISTFFGKIWTIDRLMLYNSSFTVHKLGAEKETRMNSVWPLKGNRGHTHKW